MMIDAPPFIASREQVVATARRYLGTPFHHQARLPGVGLDCAGVVICLSRELGIKPRSFDVTNYPATPDGISLKRYCDEHMQRIPQSAMQPGDAILVAWQNGPPQHLGIVVPHRHGVLSMVHALGPRNEYGGKARVLETRLVFGRHMKFVAAYNLPGVG